MLCAILYSTELYIRVFDVTNYLLRMQVYCSKRNVRMNLHTGHHQLLSYPNQISEVVSKMTHTDRCYRLVKP
jgi:hypothetical protein